jgi:hypothetical protein
MRSSEDVDGLVVGGHIFAWGQSWVSVFLQELRKPFLIDPMTYAFAKDPSFILREEGSLRKSYEGLRDWYDWRLGETAGRRPLRPDDFGNGNDREAIETFVTKVMEFQKGVPELSDNLQSSLKKYGEIVGEEFVKDTLSPQFFLSPYFQATDKEDPWYGITVECARVANGLGDYKPLVPILCLSEAFITDDQGREQICADMSGYDICVLWISGLNEHSASLGTLTAFKQLVEELSKRGVRTINMYGGYLSLLLHDSGIDVTCCGPGYGESKSADQPATGGGFPDRYYVPRAKVTVVEANARTFLARNPEFVCDCDTCESIATSLGLNPDMPEYDSKLDIFFQHMRGEAAQSHYIHSRGREAAAIGDSNIERLKEELALHESGLNEANSAAFGIPTSHLGRWASLF